MHGMQEEVEKNEIEIDGEKQEKEMREKHMDVPTTIGDGKVEEIKI